ncbi:MAG: alpha-hydroxy-acid oxidizing protein [Acidobacteria bacterium]|nr:alpha-hydroxy-acid oxidizing protein [Acidobacteriota bacterium]
MTGPGVSRRRALERFGALLAASPLLPAQELAGEPPGRITPRQEAVNVFEVAAVAERKLPATVYSSIGGGDRRAFERLTFRPRMLVNVAEIDLTTELLGEKMFAPILAGPVWQQQQFHPEGELAAARGASLARTVMVVSARSSYPIAQIAAATKTTLWIQDYPEADVGAVRKRIEAALAAGCKAACLTLGTPYAPAGGAHHPAKLAPMGQPRMDWKLIENLARSLKAPLLLKGIMTPEEARLAVAAGAGGLVVSNHGGMFAEGLAAPIEVLASVVDEVAGKAPVLVDGSFRRGTDILKALALGARAVLVGRPVMWGLAAYGAEGVETVLNMLQSELARSMGLCGKPNLAGLDRSLVKIHRR